MLSARAEDDLQHEGLRLRSRKTPSQRSPQGHMKHSALQNVLTAKQPQMFQTSFTLFVASCLASSPLMAQDVVFQEDVVGFIKEHCALCHDDLEPEAGLDLTRFSSIEDARKEEEVWFAVEAQLLAGEMPPKNEPRPEQAKIDSLLAWISAEFGAVTPESAPPGNVVLRRLNSVEYSNSIADLTGVEFDAEGFFPADAVGHGFNTVGEALSVSELSLERYLEAADLIASEAILLERKGLPQTRKYKGDLKSDRGEFHGGGLWLPWVAEAQATHTFPRDGEYILRFSAWSTRGGDEEAKVALRLDGERLKVFEIPGAKGDPDTHELQVRIKAGEHMIAARFINDFYEPAKADGPQRDRNVMIQFIEVTGPIDPLDLSSFQQHLLSEEVTGSGTLRRRQQRVLEHLAERIWRRPISRTELGRLERTIPEGSNLEEGVRLALTVLLSSPHFIYRVEFGREAEENADAVQLTDWELAARLSYFIWSTCPDDELRSLAERGELSDPDMLNEQVERLLDDPRSRSLAENFATQWLQIGVLDEASPDSDLFPEFDEALRLAMREETLRFFDHILREGLPASSLLDADFSLLNEQLADHYGVDGVSGEMMRVVSLAETSRRGILGHASVLTATSNPTRTSPVRRGKWVLEALLGTPPPPPPPGSDSLEPDTEMSGATLRERFERHRDDATCAVCHDEIDPIGFALENYGPIGRWREQSEGQAIDATGEFPDGYTFDGPGEMGSHLLNGDRFEHALAEKLLIYALGRGLVRTDRGHIMKILGQAGAEPSLRGMIRAVVFTRAFTMLSTDS
jgi:hypothetical protein